VTIEKSNQIKRDIAISRFQRCFYYKNKSTDELHLSSDRVDILISSEGYASEAITLNKASYLVHFTDSALPQRSEQVFARIHRVGQKNDPVFGFTFVANHWVDRRAHDKGQLRKNLAAAPIFKMSQVQFDEYQETLGIKKKARRIAAVDDEECV